MWKICNDHDIRRWAVVWLSPASFCAKSQTQKGWRISIDGYIIYTIFQNFSFFLLIVLVFLKQINFIAWLTMLSIMSWLNYLHFAIDKNKNKLIGLDPPIFKGIERKGYRVPTPIQRRVSQLIIPINHRCKSSCLKNSFRLLHLILV